MSICSIAGCGKYTKARSMCAKHFKEDRLAKAPPCSREGCDRKAYVKGECQKHYMQTYKPAWRAEHPEKELIYDRKHKKRNGPALREKAKGYYYRDHEQSKARLRERNKAAYQRDPEPFRASRLKYVFGITKWQYEEMFRQQEGKCAICKKDSSEETKRLAVDHCHKTGFVRGLLCSRCNTGIGQLRDDPDLLVEAACYIVKHRELQAAS